MSSHADLDLTEFVSKLIQDTFNAITISSKEQAEVYYELKRLTALDFDEFREKYIIQSDIDAKLSELFPLEDNSQGLHAINVGLPYLYNFKSKEEMPALETILDHNSSDLQKKSNYLSQQTVTEVNDLVKDLLANQQYSSFQDIMSRGVPRVIIDSGRILAKVSLNYAITEETEANNSASAEKVSAAMKGLSIAKVTAITANSQINDKIRYQNIAAKLAKTRVGVTIPNPANEATIQSSSLWGEIEIKFKAVD